MSIPRNYPAGESYNTNGKGRAGSEHNGTEPLSGSKKVKNRQHSKRNQGEGS